jgi:hypothetical protein
MGKRSYGFAVKPNHYKAHLTTCHSNYPSLSCKEKVQLRVLRHWQVARQIAIEELTRLVQALSQLAHEPNELPNIQTLSQPIPHLSIHYDGLLCTRILPIHMQEREEYGYALPRTTLVEEIRVQGPPNQHHKTAYRKDYT